VVGQHRTSRVAIAGVLVVLRSDAQLTPGLVALGQFIIWLHTVNTLIAIALELDLQQLLGLFLGKLPLTPTDGDEALVLLAVVKGQAGRMFVSIKLDFPIQFNNGNIVVELRVLEKRMWPKSQHAKVLRLCIILVIIELQLAQTHNVDFTTGDIQKSISYQ